MEALCVTEESLTIGRAPKDLVIEKSDSCLGAKPVSQPTRDLGESRDLLLPLLPHRGDEFKAGGRKADDLSRVQLRSISWTVRAIA